MRKTVGIIGGGPAGLMAAIMASKKHKVIIFEKNEQCGKKLLMTGNGRCNLTNNRQPNEFFKYCNKNSKFLYNALNSFGPQEIMQFFEDQGCALKEEKNHCIFPVSDKAQDILQVLLKQASNVEIKYGQEIIKVNAQDNVIQSVSSIDHEYPVDHLIICTGGLSYPQTGSNGAGYKFLKQLNHTITPLSPCEVPLCSNNHKDIFAQSIMGIALSNKLVEIVKDNKVKAKCNKDIMITHYGFSGPATLELSEKALDNLPCSLRICHNLKEFKGFKETKEALNVPKRYWDYLMKGLTIKPIEQISKKDQENLFNHFNYQTFEISGSLGIEKAIITKGGVSCAEFDRHTLQSKHIKNLSVCGEILDVHGSVGGFNLTLAISSGYLAGNSLRNEL